MAPDLVVSQLTKTSSQKEEHERCIELFPYCIAWPRGRGLVACEDDCTADELAFANPAISVWQLQIPLNCRRPRKAPAEREDRVHLRIGRREPHKRAYPRRPCRKQRVPQQGQIHRAYRDVPIYTRLGLTPNPLLSCRCNCEHTKTANNHTLALTCPCTHAQSLTHESWCYKSHFTARKHASRGFRVWGLGFGVWGDPTGKLGS